MVPYVVMGAFVLVIAVVFSFVRLPEIKHDDDKANEVSSSSVGNLKQLFRNKMFVFGLSALLAYEVAEISSTAISLTL